MIRKCFTVNPNRTKDEIQDYEKCLKSGVFHGCEFFYPYNKDEEHKKTYIDSLKKYLKYDCEFVCHLPYGKLNNLATYQNLEEVMQRFYDAIDFASNLPTIKLTLHPGELDGTLSKVDAINLSCLNIKKLCQHAAKYNMIIMLENLIGTHELMKTPEEYFEIKEKINEPNLKFIFDVAHYHTSHQENKNINLFVEKVKEDLMHLHISDNNGLTDMHAKIGKGNIDFYSYFKKLEEIGYNGLYSSEILFNTSDELFENANAFDNVLKRG